MSSLHIHRGSQVIICGKTFVDSHQNGLTIEYRLPKTISEEFLKVNSLYINVEGPNIINRVVLHSFKSLSSEKLEDGSQFLYSNSGIPFYYDNTVTVHLNRKRYKANTIHILLDPTKEERLVIKQAVNDKMYWYNIVSRIEKVLVVLLILFLLFVLSFLIYWFKDSLVRFITTSYISCNRIIF